MSLQFRNLFKYIYVNKVLNYKQYILHSLLTAQHEEKHQ
jgi:hypothetical protein